jgi:hypothetical protein
MNRVTYSWLAVVLAVAAAAIGWLGLAGWLAVVVVLASIGMHVAGNALGTQLRDATDRRLAPERLRATAAPQLPACRPTQLGRRASLGLLVPVSAGIGAACGGVAGSTALFLLASSSPVGAIIGGVSSAVLGGLFGFLAASFVEIVRTSLKEALAAERTGGPSRP